MGIIPLSKNENSQIGNNLAIVIQLIRAELGIGWDCLFQLPHFIAKKTEDENGEATW